MYVVFRLHKYLSYGLQGMPEQKIKVQGMAGFLPVFDTHEEALEFAGGEWLVGKLELIGEVKKMQIPNHKEGNDG